MIVAAHLQCAWGWCDALEQLRRFWWDACCDALLARLSMNPYLHTCACVDNTHQHAARQGQQARDTASKSSTADKHAVSLQAVH